MACIAFINKLWASPSSRAHLIWFSELSPTMRRLSEALHAQPAGEKVIDVQAIEQVPDFIERR